MDNRKHDEILENILSISNAQDGQIKLLNDKIENLYSATTHKSQTIQLKTIKFHTVTLKIFNHVTDNCWFSNMTDANQIITQSRN